MTDVMNYMLHFKGFILNFVANNNLVYDYTV